MFIHFGGHAKIHCFVIYFNFDFLLNNIDRLNDYNYHDVNDIVISLCELTMDVLCGTVARRNLMVTMILDLEV